MNFYCSSIQSVLLVLEQDSIALMHLCKCQSLVPYCNTDSSQIKSKVKISSNIVNDQSLACCHLKPYKLQVLLLKIPWELCALVNTITIHNYYLYYCVYSVRMCGHISTVWWKLESIYLKQQHIICGQPGNHCCDSLESHPNSP